MAIITRLMTSFVLNSRKGQNYFFLLRRETNFCFVLQGSDVYLPLKFVHLLADKIYVYAYLTQLYCFLSYCFSLNLRNLFLTLTNLFISRKEQYHTIHCFLALIYLPHEWYIRGEKLSICSSNFQNLLLLLLFIIIIKSVPLEARGAQRVPGN